MNTMNEIEARLRSWVPRRPSPKLKQRLLASANRTDAALDAHRPYGFRLAWLAPATMAALLMCVMYNQRNGFSFHESAASGTMVAIALSNQSAAAWLPGSFQHEQNSLPVGTFALAGDGSTSSNHSVSARGHH